MLMNEDEIKEILKKQEETFIIVKKLWRAEKWRRFFSIAKYVIFLGIIFGVFYFLTPYVERGIKLFQDLKNLQNIQTPQNFLQKFLE